MEDASVAWRRRAPLRYTVRMERLDHPSAYPSFLPLIVGPANFPALVKRITVIVHKTILLKAVGKEAPTVPAPTPPIPTIERAWSAARNVGPQLWGWPILSALYMIGDIS